MSRRAGGEKGGLGLWGWAAGILAVVLAAVAALAVWVGLPRPFAGKPVPSPNGYDDLAAAAGLVSGKPVSTGELADATDDDLRAIVRDNREALERARLGLGRPSVVPLPKGSTLDDRMRDVRAFRGLAVLLLDEAALAEREGRPADAAAVDLDVARLGRAATDGGLLLDKMVGVAFESMAAEGLARVAPRLSAAEARKAAAATWELALGDGRESIGAVMARDKAFTLARGGWQVRATFMFYPSVTRTLLKPAEDAVAQADKRGLAVLRLAALTLALRAYALDHPDAPVPPTPGALAPEYLPAVPDDPFGRGPLRVKAEGGAAWPYSVGPDGKDNGGVDRPEGLPLPPDDLRIGRLKKP